MSEKKVRWGIMSTASIGKRSVIPGIQESKRNIVEAVASRSLKNAQAYADELGIPKAYGSYEELLNDPAIDAVYIPLPNHLHKEWTLKAAKAGKHILCEKPIALDETEAEEMIAACKDAGVVLAEAYMYRHQKRYGDIKSLIHNGEIGDIRSIHGVFTFNGAQDTMNDSVRKGSKNLMMFKLMYRTVPILIATAANKRGHPILRTSKAFFNEGCNFM